MKKQYQQPLCTLLNLEDDIVKTSTFSETDVPYSWQGSEIDDNPWD